VHVLTFVVPLDRVDPGYIRLVVPTTWTPPHITVAVIGSASISGMLCGTLGRTCCNRISLLVWRPSNSRDDCDRFWTRLIFHLRRSDDITAWRTGQSSLAASKLFPNEFSTKLLYKHPHGMGIATPHLHGAIASIADTPHRRTNSW